MITIEQLKIYAKAESYEDDLLQIHLDTAYSMIEDYIGYSLEEKAYTYNLTYKDIYGKDNQYILLKAFPATDIELTINGEVYTDYTIDNFVLYFNKAILKTDLVAISYLAGYSVYPPVIDNTALEIATLLIMEAGQNIGLTSKSFDGGMSRQFVNYTNYDKYLSKLKGFKISIC